MFKSFTLPPLPLSNNTQNCVLFAGKHRRCQQLNSHDVYTHSQVSHTKPRAVGLKNPQPFDKCIVFVLTLDCMIKKHVWMSIMV